jgi:N4-(beta-N-acetylglucosaminyl)-L-asparaginase
MKRRSFLGKTFIGSLATLIVPKALSASDKQNSSEVIKNVKGPISICTWNFVKANAAAGKALESDLDALSSAIKAAEVEELNDKNTTVGYGGAPDREGNVTLDACVMDHKGGCGSVVAVQNIVHVAALARDVMEKTPHVMLAAEGAESFAKSLGYKQTNLLTEQSKESWLEWSKNSKYKPIINIENHDTIGVLCMDKKGNIAGACSTSGLSYKMKGRVGDSPIIGSGLYVDNEIGGAVATGMGEEIVKTVGSFLIVELMRQGYSPQDACDEAIQRIIRKQGEHVDFQVAYIALDKQGRVGSSSIHKGFTYMKYQNGENKNIEVNNFINS